MALLELGDVVASYGDIEALHGVSLTVGEGEVVAVLGPNGAGKTTMLRAVSGTVRKSGEVVFDGRKVDRRAPEQIARLGVAHVPEGRGIYTQLSVRDNLRMGAYTRRDRGGVKRDFERVVGYFPWLERRVGQKAGTLSGGEQQMLAIARAVMSRPRLLLLDEPSLGLAPIVSREIFRIVRALNDDEGVSVLLVEQNARAALEIASSAYVLEAGRVAVAGEAKTLQANESIRRVYLGY
ncbi:MAG TPA: ABC transporter ATP-binding protein [Gaiellaceae bacterium]|jgi:branched-chain amino acid transport system ATP-binding protein